MNRLSRTSRIFTRTLIVFSWVLFAVSLVAQLHLNQKVARAATNSTINFQARILTASGAVVADGAYNVEFKLYDTDSGGVTLWTETYDDTDKLVTKNGYITAALGTLTTFPGTINWDQQLYLTLNIGGTAETPDWDGEMDPRMKLTAVPYAFASEKLQVYNGTISGSLSIEAPTVGNQVFVIPDQAAAGTYNLCVEGSADCGFALGAAGDYIQNQNSGQQASSNFWISGTGRADTSFSTPLVLNGSTANNVLTIQGNSAAAGNTATNANIQFKVGDSGGTTAMTILNNGNVGIGTAIPNTTLNVAGAISLPGSTDNSMARPAIGASRITGEIAGYSSGGFLQDDGFLRLSAGGGTNWWQKSYIDLSGFSLDGDMDNTIVFGTSGTEKMRINSTGNVGIGDTTPDQKLEVMSNAEASTQITVSNINAGDYDAQLGFELGDTGTNLFTMGVDDSDGDKFKISTTALGANDFLTIDGTNNQIKIGNDTGTGSDTTLFILDSANTTSGLAAVNGAMFYNTSSKRIECYENDVWGNCADASLQEAYRSSVGSTTPEILLDDTRYGLDIQDANSSLGSSVALLAIRGSATASTLGASLFQVNNNSDSPLVGIGMGSQAMATGIDLQFGGSANRVIQILQNTSSGTGRTLTVEAGQGNGGAGGQLVLNGGDGEGGDYNGGNIVLSGGTPAGSGVKGWVFIDTPAYSTASTQDCGTSCTITQANIDSYGAVVINATASSLTISMPDPTITTAGRVVYVTAADGSNDFSLSINGGGSGNIIAMRENTTATMIWNGSDWTAAGASSSTTLQAAYDNTLTSAGGAEIILNNTASSDGLTIRNNATSPIIGGILEVQTSIGSNLFSVNNNATEYAKNGGAETAGASSSAFPASTWADSPDGGTVTRYITAGSYIATGQASVSVEASAADDGVANTLAEALTANLKYSVSFAVKGTSSFSTLDVYYSKDGTTTGMTECTTDQEVTTGIWTRVLCTFTAPSSGITSSNAIIIKQSDSTSRTFYIDNLSVTVSADVNHAADGSADDDSNFSTNWTAAPAGGTVTQDTGTIYDTSASVKVVTSATEHHGITNNLEITPQISTQYLVSLYARSSNSFSDLTIRYSRDGGTNFASCTDYNTQTISTTGWTKVTCLFTTDGTTATNPDLVISQGSATARTFYIDALSVTLNTNNASNVQIGGGNEGGPTTLFTLDRASSAPIAANNDAYLGSMYYDTTTGRIQCYEADGWGACGSAPDNIVNLNPEYAGAVLNGTGVGTMTADFCGNGGGLSVNTDYCDSGEARNYYRWTSPQATQQTYSIYVTYQLPASFKDFSSDDTVQLTARRDSSNAAVTYEMFRVENGSIYQCGSGETTVTTTDDTWETVGINGNESTGCGFTTSSASAFIIFKINLKANSNANAYVGTLSFTTTGR